MTQASELLAQLDRAGPTSGDELESAIAALGDLAVDDLLDSIHLINSKLNGSAQVRSVDPVREMMALERRVRILGRMKAQNTLKAVFDAVADSAIAVSAYRRQGDVDSIVVRMAAYEHQMAAESLLRTATATLVAFGDVIIAPARRHMEQGPPEVTKALRRAVARVEKKWWQFWR